MRLAFIVVAHRYPLQLARLINRLAAPNARVYLHVDRGAPAGVFRAMQRELVGVQDLTWLDRNYSRWGSIGQVQAALTGLRAAAGQCDYALVLSGQDYPIRPVAALDAYLSRHAGASYVNFRPLPSGGWPRDGAARVARWHIWLPRRFAAWQPRVERRLSWLLDRLWPRGPLPLGMTAYGGTNWLCLPAPAIRYVLQFVRDHPDAVNYFKNVGHPDEAFFQTVLGNSPLRPTLRDHILTYVDWNGPPFPRVLGLDDFEALAASGKFFARKFDPALSAGLMDRIDAELLQPAAGLLK